MAGWVGSKELIIRLTQSSWAGGRTELGNTETQNIMPGRPAQCKELKSNYFEMFVLWLLSSTICESSSINEQDSARNQ